jgi:hypothetical protein
MSMKMMDPFVSKKDAFLSAIKKVDPFGFGK